MKRTIIVADDNSMDRRLLRKQLQNEYNILEAVNGQELLELLEKESARVSAVVMDIIMPVLGGFEALQRIRASINCRSIPVMMVSVENDLETKRKAQEYGANGFLSKPYDPYLIRGSLENMISYRENLTLLDTLSKDKLTGMISHELFFDECDKLIQSHEPGYYTLSCIDVDHFKVINDQYGMEVGDEVLKHIAGCISICYRDLSGLACRYSADRFAVLYPSSLANTAVVLDNHKKVVSPPCLKHSIRVCIGRYLIRDLSLSAVTIFDRATVAEESVKGRYDVYIAEYDDSMRAKILQEQQLVVDMREALNKGEFIPFLQPQYNHATGALIGAEVLVRWKKGDHFILPGEFISIFEKNGFIYEVDKSVWEQTCQLLRKWLDQNLQPLPVSVNVSRIDLYREDFFEVLCGLVKKYRLPVDLFRIEVTESAFSDSPEHIVHIVNRLIQYGFAVEIDDFGCGYSSLNTLKDVPASILKLDMQFFAKTENAERSGIIIESVIRMAKWLGMAVIAEGVERPEQADYLKSIGCYYIQGYLYAAPMSVEEYEKKLVGLSHEKKLTRLQTIATLDNGQFWNPDSMETLIFNSYIGGACILEQNKGQLELLRVNSQYLVELSNIISDEVSLSAMNPVNYLDSNNLFLLNQTIIEAVTSKNETFCELAINVMGQETEYIRYSVRLIASASERNLIYCVVQNMTEQRRTEKKLMDVERKEYENAQRLKVIMDNVNGGVSAIQIERDRSSKPIFNNERYYELYGYTRKQAEEEKLDVMTMILPEDIGPLMEKIEQLKKDRKPTVIDYRIRKRDGSLAQLRSMSSVMRMAEYGNDIITSVVSDVTEKRSMEDQLQFLNDSAHDILAQPDTGLAIHDTLHKLLQYFRADRCYVIEIDYERMVSVNTYEVCDENVTSEIENLQAVPFTYEDYWYRALAKDNKCIIESVEKLGDEEEELRQLLLMQNIHSIIFVSLMRDGKLIGFLGLDNAKGMYNQVERLMAVADYIAILLTRRDLEINVERGNRELNQLINDTPGGFCRVVITEGKRPSLIAMNEGFCQMLEMSREAVLQEYGGDMYRCMEFEDVEAFIAEYKKVIIEGGQFTTRCRLRRKKGDELWTMVIGRVIMGKDGHRYINAYFSDITDQLEKETQEKKLLDYLPVGAALYEYDGKQLSAVHFNKKYWELMERDPITYKDDTFLSAVHPEDIEKVMKEINMAIQQKRNASVDIRILQGKDGYVKFHISANILQKPGGSYQLYATYERMMSHIQ